MSLFYLPTSKTVIKRQFQHLIWKFIDYSESGLPSLAPKENGTWKVRCNLWSERSSQLWPFSKWSAVDRSCALGIVLLKSKEENVGSQVPAGRVSLGREITSHTTQLLGWNSQSRADNQLPSFNNMCQAEHFINNPASNHCNIWEPFLSRMLAGNILCESCLFSEKKRSSSLDMFSATNQCLVRLMHCAIP